MKEKRQWDWGKIAAVLCAVLLAVNLWQVRKLSDLRGELGSAETNLQLETRRLDERIQAVQRVVIDADKLVQDFEVVSVSPDRASRCLRAEVSLRLKEWREDTQVRLTAVQGTDTWNAAMTGGGGQYAGAVEIPMNDQEIRFLAQVSAEGLQKEEELFTWESASMLLPVQCYGNGVGGPDYARDADKNGMLTVTSCEAELTGYETRDLPDLSGQVFRLRRNGDIAAEETAMFGNTIGQYTCQGMSAKAQAGDWFALTFFCRDASGLGYEFFLRGWSIGEDGIVERTAPETDWPRLTWD